MTLPDNAPEKWEYHQHTKVKHQILEKYLRSWISIVGRPDGSLGYVDGFAGRGIYEDGSPGSPIIVMKAAQDQINKLGKPKNFLCLFIENNPDNFDSLQRQVEKEKKSCPRVICQLSKGNFDVELTDFLNGFKPKQLIPIFYFIDPFGWAGIPFELVRRILVQPKSEIFFTFMIYEISRFLRSLPHSGSLNTLFGDDSWKEVVNLHGRKREQALIQLYELKLNSETEAEFVWSFRMSDSYISRTKYYLIHTTHHFKGLKVMKDIMKNQGSGIFEFLGPDEDLLRRTIRLDAFTSSLEDALCEYFKGRAVTFDDLCEELYPLNRQYLSQFIERDFRRALKKLEEEGDPRLKIKRITSKRNGLRGKDIIYFRP